jgi:uncharacterized membrane protein
MTSTIKYKFRSATSYEAISLPGTSARLFDIKKAIVKAKDLGKNGPNAAALEFDLKIVNAMTNESYDDESMVLPRGTCLIVQRLPAAKGQGLLARLARVDAGLMSVTNMNSGAGGAGSANGQRGGGIAGGGSSVVRKAAENGYYTMQNNDEDEFIDANTTINGTNINTVTTTSIDNNYDEDEDAKLRAVLPGQSVSTSSTLNTRNINNNAPKPFSAPPPPSKFTKPITQHVPQANTNNYPTRPNADPTLREIEQQQALLENSNKPLKKTGIPHTFHQPGKKSSSSDNPNDNNTSSSAHLNDDSTASKAFETGFNQLLDRGGGQSTSSTSSKKRNLEYALQLTATEIPDHLQCGICHKVVKDALFIPWDDEYRSTCDLCMRKGLSENRLRCPLTGQDGVSPDDLKPNMGLRKAAEAFEKSVMEKMNEIIQAQEEEEELEKKREKEERALMMEGEQSGGSKSNVDYEGDVNEKGVIMRKGLIKRGGKKSYDDDLFGGEDDFGGDVFAVTRVEQEDNNDTIENEEEEQIVGGKQNEDDPVSANVVEDNKNDDEKDNADDAEKSFDEHTTDNVKTNIHSKNDVDSSSILHSDGKDHHDDDEIKTSNEKNTFNNNNTPQSPHSSTSTMSRREKLKNRGPPAGYVMGPAGINKNNPTMASSGGPGYQQQTFRGRGGRGSYRGRQGNQRGRGGNNFNNNGFYQHQQSHGVGGNIPQVSYRNNLTLPVSM